MDTVQTIFQNLCELAPLSYQCEWDNSGLLAGRADQPVNRILVALDPSLEAVLEAKELGAELLVTHHPLFFSLRHITDQEPSGRVLLPLLQGDMALISMHTNLDSARGGVNDALAAALRLESPQILAEEGRDEEGWPYGLGRFGNVPSQSLAEFVAFVRQALPCPGLRYGDAGRPVRRVAVGGGACGEYLSQAIVAGCDTFVTGDVKYHGFREAVERGINLIDAGHFATEQVICPWLAQRLATAFPQVQVSISQQHQDVVRFLV